MNETTDPNGQILLVVMIAFYWAMLSSWSQLLSRWNDSRTNRAAAPTRGDGDIEHPGDGPLDALREIDTQFDLTEFLHGAKMAYEAVLRAYAEGDIQTLKCLVGPEVFHVFEREVAGRRDREEMLQLTFIGTREAKFVDAVVEDGTAEIVVRYVSEVVCVTRSADSAIIAGDPLQLVEVIDSWTFACHIPSMRRNWMLIATEGE